MDIHHCKENPQIIFATQGTDATIDVLRMQAMIFEAEKESACRVTKNKVGRDVGILPRK